MNKRRDFIKTTGLLAAGSLLVPGCAPSAKSENTDTTASAAANEPPVLKPKWDIGIQLYTLRNQIKEDLAGTIAKVAETGYKHLELFGYRNREYFGMPANDFYKLCSDNGLGVSSSHHGTGRVRDVGVQGTLLTGFELAVEDAVNAGQTHIVCPYLLPEERKTLDDYKELAEMLNKAGEVCKQAEVTFAYHNHDFEFQELEGQIPMYMLLDETDPELVKMELDIYWIEKAGYSALEFFKKYPGRTALWHVKDLGEDGSTVAVGTGTIDYTQVFAAAGESGLQKFFVEQDNSPDPIADIAVSHKALKEILAG